MTQLELLKKKAELLKVKAAEGDIELRIAMAMDEIERLEKALVIQKEAAQRLEEELNK